MTTEDPAVILEQLEATTRLYEEKLATLSVFNNALQNENTQLRDALEESQAPRSATEEEVIELKAECTRRVAAADKDVARLKEKNEQLRSKLNAASQGGTSTQTKLRDREEQITRLQSEGEAATRKSSELESMVRRLRAAAREAEADRDRALSRLKHNDAQLSQEREQQALALRASADQVAGLRASYEDLQRRAQEQISAALEEATSAASAAATAAERGSMAELESAYERESALAATIDGLRTELEDAHQTAGFREETLRREVVELESSLREREAEAAQSISAAHEGTRPLLRQIESMAASAKAQDRATADAERKLQEQTSRLEEAQRGLHELELSGKAKLKQAALESAAARKAVAESTSALTAAQHALKLERLGADELRGKLAAAESRVQSLGSSLASERQAHEAERRELRARADAAQEQARTLALRLEDELKDSEVRLANGRPGETQASPPGLSAKTSALPISTSSQVLEAQAEASPRTGAGGSRPSRKGAGSVPASLHDHGDAACHRRIMAAEAVAEQANEELLRACKRAEAAQADASKLHATLVGMQALEAKHGIALELLGERNERVETLEDDIRDMKHIFHTQLSSLVDELNALRTRGQCESPAESRHTSV